MASMPSLHSVTALCAEDSFLLSPGNPKSSFIFSHTFCLLLRISIPGAIRLLKRPDGVDRSLDIDCEGMGRAILSPP